MKISPTLAVALAFFTFSSLANAQKGKGGDQDHREVHRDMSAVEAEIRALIDQNEALTKAALDRSDELKQLNRDLSRADRGDKQKLINRIQDLTHAERLENLQSQLNSIKIQGLNLEMQTLTRYDEHLIEEGGGGRNGEGYHSRAPQIRSINVIKSERGDPIRVSGRGFGYYTTNIYEVTFSDGSRQRVESKEFSPAQRR